MEKEISNKENGISIFSIIMLKLLSRRDNNMSNNIRPLSDLRNNFADICKTVHESDEPVFLTKNGFGELVVLSMDAYEKMHFDCEVYSRLSESEKNAELKGEYYSHKDVLKAMKKAANGK